MEKLNASHVELDDRRSRDNNNLPDGFYPTTPDERRLSRAVNRKLDIFLLPFLALLYLFNGLDRGNVGNAETQGQEGHLIGNICILTALNRLLQGDWCQAPGCQRCRVVLFHHLCYLPADLLWRWPDRRSQTLDSFPHGMYASVRSQSSG